MAAIRIVISLILTVLLISGCSSNTITQKDKQPIAVKNTNKITYGTSHKKPDSNVGQPKGNTSNASTPKNTQKQRTGRFSVPLLYVIDGDTIKVEINGKEESVRFLLVDTPETHHPRLGVQPFGPEAAAFTKQLLSGKTVLLEKDVSERDKYGRLLMYVYTPDGRSVQEALLKNGLARVAYVFPPNTKYVDKYYAIQKDAQKRGVGIWSIENYAQQDGFHPDALKRSKKATAKTGGSSSKGVFAPDVNGNCGGKIKGNQGSNGWIYHLPGGEFYNVTKAEQCFQTEQAAQQAGYRKSAK